MKIEVRNVKLTKELATKNITGVWCDLYINDRYCAMVDACFSGNYKMDIYNLEGCIEILEEANNYFTSKPLDYSGGYSKPFQPSFEGEILRLIKEHVENR